MATTRDAAELAELVFFAGEGLPLHVWTGLALPGQDPWDIGRARQAEKAGAGEIVVADFGEGAVAGLTGYVIGPEPEPVTDDIPALFRPLIELENLAPDSWYVNVLASYPEHRGKGLGKRLLGIAERIARSEGQNRMSLVVSAQNDGAMRLYAREGYVETARLPCDPGDWVTDTREWVLMIKPLPL
ncbi:GCN5 family acetyltransferase [Oceanicola sp. 22II-s10i]|nr:GCN5 family acetyltransferase [Oceanicola sp. 22II-s10i]